MNHLLFPQIHSMLWANFYLQNIFFPFFLAIDQNLISPSVWRPNTASFIKLLWSPCTGQDSTLHPSFHIVTFHLVDTLDPLWLGWNLEGRDPVLHHWAPRSHSSWQLSLRSLLRSLRCCCFPTFANPRTPMHVTSLLFCRIKPNSSIWCSRPFPNWPPPTI